MRWYRCFSTKEERKEWEKAEKKEDQNFIVCMHMTVDQLAKELPVPDETKERFKYVTVYTYRGEL